MDVGSCEIIDFVHVVAKEYAEEISDWLKQFLCSRNYYRHISHFMQSISLDKVMKMIWK
jgi:hypothetical protein